MLERTYHVEFMNKKRIRSYMRLTSSLVFGLLYIPHLVIGGGNRLVRSDLKKNRILNWIEITCAYTIVISFA